MDILDEKHDIFEELQRLRKLISEHNKECDKLCDNKKRCGYEQYNRDCGNCTKDFKIEP